MKRWLIGISLLVAMALVFIYILIPRSLVISSFVPVNATPSAAFRFLSDQERWKKWWPGTFPDSTGANGSSSPVFTFHAERFSTGQKFLHAVEISMTDSRDTFSSTATVLAIAGDSAVVQWESQLDAGINPVGRVRQYLRARRIKNTMNGILSGLQAFMDKKENIYGQVLTRSSTIDTLLVATKATFSHYPTTNDIYRQIDLLQLYTEGQGAKQTGHPILNITRPDTDSFLLMVALPVNKELKGQGAIFPRKMVPGRFIVSEVQGSQARVDQALAEIQNYFDDYKKVSMAIRFQSLVTDRRREPDSSKWVTKLYAPVF